MPTAFGDPPGWQASWQDGTLRYYAIALRGPIQDAPERHRQTGQAHGSHNENGRHKGARRVSR